MIQKYPAIFGLLIANASAKLEPLTVYAKKFESPKSETTSAIEILTADELERIQENRLLGGLNYVPGVQGLSTAGQTGNLGTVIFRGLSTKYMQVVIDGVRLTDATNGANNFLGNAQLLGISQMEVLRGPQSVLYGSGAAGGVVGYETALGNGESASVSAEAGNFGTFRSTLLTEGTVGDLSYSVGAGYFETENDPQGNQFRHDFQQAFETIALEWRLREDLSLRFSYRGSQNELQTASGSGLGLSTAGIDTDTNLAALNLSYEVNPWWKSRLTLGHYHEGYDALFLSAFDPFLVLTDYDRSTMNWANEIELGDSVNLQMGIDYARSDYQDLNGRDIDYRTAGVYLNGTWSPSEELLLEAGVRYEDHNKFGSDLAWNLGFAYELGENGTRFRGRVAEAYRTPTLLESEAFMGAFTNQIANSNLTEEEILGLEIGIEQELSGHRLDLTYFQQHLENAIVSNFDPVGFSTQNVNQAGLSKVSGLEFSSTGDLSDWVTYRLAVTKQFKEDVIDIPDLQVSFDAHYQAEKWGVGAGVNFVDAASYGLLGTTDSRTTARIYGEYELNDSISLYSRVENISDEDYFISDDSFSPVAGQGRSFIIGAKLAW